VGSIPQNTGVRPSNRGLRVFSARTPVFCVRSRAVADRRQGQATGTGAGDGEVDLGPGAQDFLRCSLISENLVRRF
jgi:hypothetical protein